MVSPESELYFSDRGVILRGGPRVSEATFDAHGVATVAAPWGDIRTVSLVDPWPGCRLGLEAHGRRHADVWWWSRRVDPEQLEARVVALVLEAERRGIPVDRGWLDRPEVRWEPVDRFPLEDASRAEVAVYRGLSAGRVLAERPAIRPGGLVVLGVVCGGCISAMVFVPLLVTTAPLLIPPALVVGVTVGAAIGRVVGRMPVDAPAHVLSYPEVAVTADHVWARVGEHAYRIPLGTIAARVEVRRDDEGNAIARRYVFGRSAALDLAVQPDCPVEALLDARLAARASG